MRPRFWPLRRDAFNCASRSPHFNQHTEFSNTNSDKADTAKATGQHANTTPLTDAKHDDTGIKNAIKSKAPGNHANAKITARPTGQDAIDLHKRKSI